MRRRLAAVLSALLILAGCQPQQPPNTAAPTSPNAPPGIGLPAPEGGRRYDAAIKPVEEARTVRSVQPPRAVPPAQPSERERRAIAAWEQEEAAARRSPLTVAPPPRTRSALALPGDDGALPAPAGERSMIERRPRSEVTVPPSTGGRADAPKPAEAARRAPSPAASAPQAAPAPAPPPPPPAPPVKQAEAVPSSASPAPPAQTATAAAPEPRRQPPPGTPLTTVIFTPRSANLSDGARFALGFFAQDPKTQRLRRIELWASSSAEDPADAGKIAFARVLAVHAFLIDLGVKVDIEIGGYFDAQGLGADRVDVMAPAR